MNRVALEQFLVLSESLHFSRASELCHVSPSTLSRVVQRLESEVGAPLLYRDNRSVMLTPAGREFQRYAREVVERWWQLKERIGESGPLGGELSIYCSVTASYRFLPELLSEFRRRHPGVEINLRTGDAALSLPKLMGGEADLVIAARPEELSADFHFQPISETPLQLIAPLLEGGVLSSLEAGASWYELPLVQAESGLARTYLDAWFVEQGIEPNVYATVAGNEAIVAMVNLGCGVGVVPELVLQNSPVVDRVKVLPIEPRLPAFEIGLCVRGRSLQKPAIKALWSIAESVRR
ncbi:HTH-type transcriptional activator IlvY [Aestuariirhabdus litorea]|uniref:HTH-type transcriptional activator IlvY n=1 Tax=Aestuariirhabdus litorea TaxID=2528527 RepID=A0A3P3VIQ5_9GAMM|nr:HTH-type transcriptional activator IlvY [Aestuariirhabdus litorea]RRJ82234.1 HTH-type transcriptional activator IlvY [Aestuariirhabdus litorea]RWW92402.1 HTH-type transcriptional activator IlvY [Endozoicomonadaceae bacterium GTF-13]